MKCCWQCQSGTEVGLMANARGAGRITQLVNILLKFPQNYSYQYIDILYIMNIIKFIQYELFLHIKIN